MSRQRQTQHRLQREEQRSREIADYKRENRLLQKQVKQLRKELERHIGTTTTEEAEVLAEPEPTVPTCPKDETPLKELKLGPSTWIVCPTCQWRKKL